MRTINQNVVTKNLETSASHPLLAGGNQSGFTVNPCKAGELLLNKELLKKPFKNSIKGIVGHPLNSATLLHYSSKEIVYSFNKSNNLYPIITKTEYLLKSLFLSMYSLISRPVYLIKHDKIIIRLFVFLSPKADKYLDSSTIVKGDKLRGASASIFIAKRIRGQSVSAPLTKGSLNPLSSSNLAPSSPSCPLGVKAASVFLGGKDASDPLYRGLAAKAEDGLRLFPTGKEGGAGEVEKRVGWNNGRDGINRIRQFLKIKSIRPNTVEILNTQMKLKVNSLSSMPSFVNMTSSKADLPLLSASSARYAEGADDAKQAYTSLVSNFKNQLEKVSVIFSKIFKKKVEFEIIKAQLPFQDSNILAQVLGYNANNYKFRRMLKILIPRAVIKNPSKELTSPSPYPMLAALNLLNTDGTAYRSASPATQAGGLGLGLPSSNHKWSGWGAKDLNMLFSQPSSYLPPFFHSKIYLDGIYSALFTAFGSSLRACNLPGHTTFPLAFGLAMDKARASRSVTSGTLALTSYAKRSVTSQPITSSVCSAAFPSLAEGRGKTVPSGGEWNGMCSGEHNPTSTKRVGLAYGLTEGRRALPSYLSGMNIKLAGRLMTESMRPRFTVQSHQEGSLARVKVHFTEKSRFTGKNKRGAFSFTVTISHVLN